MTSAFSHNWVFLFCLFGFGEFAERNADLTTRSVESEEFAGGVDGKEDVVGEGVLVVAAVVQDDVVAAAATRSVRN